MLDAGSVIADRFEIQAWAGSGGMGVVYKARDRTSGELVAVKIVRQASPDVLYRFDRECRAMAALSHPGVVRYVAHGCLPDRTPYLAMEWLDGIDLRSRIRGDAPEGTGEPLEPALDLADPSGIPLAEVVLLGRRLAAALAHLHTGGIVHRDLKPSNVMLPGGDVDRAVLLDLGAVRLTEASGELTSTGVLVGTPIYMAPEQVRAEAPVGPPADVFALASVLFEAALGRAPFRAPHFASALARVLMHDPPPLRATLEDAPPELDALLARMFLKAPDGRPTAAEVAWTLESIAVVGGARTAPRTMPGDGTVSSPTVGSAECRVRALLLAREGPVMPDEGSAVPESRRRASVLARLGAQLERLVDGTQLGRIVRASDPADEATRIARLALSLAAETPSLAMAIATGRSEDAALGAGELADRVGALLESTPGGTIALDELTAALLDARFEIARDGARACLLSERVVEEQRTLLGAPTRTVGRRRELAVLEATLEECAEEAVARVVLVTAGAGTGKTRLGAELLARLAARSEPRLVLSARGDSLAGGSPYGLLATALRRTAAIADPSAEDAGDRLHAALDESGVTGKRTREVLSIVAGVVPGAEPAGTVREEDIHEAVGELVGAAGAGRTIVFVLDDLQWADSPSIRCVDALLRAHTGSALFVLALARPEVHGQFPNLFADRGLTQLQLEPLAVRAATELARQVLSDRVPGSVVDALVARANGNAFFLEELIRHAAEGGTSLPDSVLGMVQARLDALDSEARRILRAASVFGEAFWQGGIETLVDARTFAFAPGEWLDRLVEMELLSPVPEARLSGQRELRFRHALLREAAYAMLPDDERKAAHVAAMEWLDAAGWRDASILARHAREGGQGARAMQLLLRAAKGTLAGRST